MIEATVIVPCYRAEATLAGCLRSLLGQATSRPFEIVVVLNNSPDGSSKVAHEIAGESAGRLRVVTESRQGAANARNRGIEVARGDVLLFIDADCRARENWAGLMLQELDDPSVSIAGGGIVGDPQQRALVARYCRKSGMLSPRLALDHPRGAFVQTANLGVRRRDAVEIGGFDPSLHSGEDADFCWRLLRGQDSGELRYVPEAEVLHRHRDTVGGLFRQSKVYGWAHVALGRRHGLHWPTALERLGGDALGLVTLPLRFLGGCGRALLESDPLPAVGPLLTAVCAAGQRAGQIDALLGRRPPYALPPGAKSSNRGAA